jgi:hypothetical protein
MPSAGWTKMSVDEVRLATAWYEEEKVAPAEIAERLGRDKATLTRLLVKTVDRKRQGRPVALTDAQVDFLEHRLDELIVKADGKYRVTAKMLRANTRTKASARAMLDALRKRNIYFRKLREKPVLTDEDIADRLAFAKKYKDKSKAWWQKNVHAFIDGKFFQVYLNGKERDRAARHATFGAFRSPGKGLSHGYVKPSKSLKHNTGAASALVQAGIVNGKVGMWYQVPGGRWSGDAAVKMYSGPLVKALKKAYPTKRSYNLLEDNDPTGYKSKKGVASKEEMHIKLFAIPKRSPDLSICDYALWKEVNKRMRNSEKAWASNKRESRVDYLARLRRTATRLPRPFVLKSIGDMKRRCLRLYKAKGFHFEEGGKGS